MRSGQASEDAGESPWSRIPRATWGSKSAALGFPQAADFVGAPFGLDSLSSAACMVVTAEGGGRHRRPRGGGAVWSDESNAALLTSLHCWQANYSL